MALLAAVFAGLFVYLVFASLSGRAWGRVRPAALRAAAGGRPKGPGWAQQWLVQAGIAVETATRGNNLEDAFVGLVGEETMRQ